MAHRESVVGTVEPGMLGEPATMVQAVAVSEAVGVCLFVGGTSLLNSWSGGGREEASIGVGPMLVSKPMGKKLDEAMA